MTESKPWYSTAYDKMLYIFGKKGKTTTTTFAIVIFYAMFLALGWPEWVATFVVGSIVSVFANTEKDKRNGVWDKVKESEQSVKRWKNEAEILVAIITLVQNGGNIEKAIEAYKNQTQIVSFSKPEEK